MVLMNIIDDRLNHLIITKETFSNNNQNNPNNPNNQNNILNNKQITTQEFKEEFKEELKEEVKKTLKKELHQKKEEFEFDEEYYQQMTKDKKVLGFEDKAEFKPWNIEKKKFPTCFKNHQHSKDRTSVGCSYGPTNYSDPHDMSSMDYNLFTLQYPQNMTLQDYVNWLYCFIGKENQLPYNHLRNLEKLKIGKKLVYEEGVLPPPGYHYPGLTAEDYFDKMYNNDNELNIAAPLHSQTNAMLGYNENDYSEFSQNLNVYGTSGQLRNPDIPYKKDAKKFHDFIDSKDSNNIETTKENDMYRIKRNEF
jgi:hypothetical protein